MSGMLITNVDDGKSFQHTSLFMYQIREEAGFDKSIGINWVNENDPSRTRTRNFNLE